jgi:hypothetical protein
MKHATDGRPGQRSGCHPTSGPTRPGAVFVYAISRSGAEPGTLRRRRRFQRCLPPTPKPRAPTTEKMFARPPPPAAASARLLRGERRRNGARASAFPYASYAASAWKSCRRRFGKEPATKTDHSSLPGRVRSP